jgi:hypothetical protein
MLSHQDAADALLALARRQQSVLFGRLVHRTEDARHWQIDGGGESLPLRCGERFKQAF